MAITSLDGIVAGLASRQALSIYKASLSNQLAGGLSSLWRPNGNPIQGNVPGAAETCVKSLAGTWNFNNPSSGYSYLAALHVLGVAASHQFMIYDRLAHMGGLSGTVTTPQTVNLAIPSSRNAAYTDSDLEWFFEIYGDIGTSGQTATVTYVDEGDASQTFTFTIGGTSPANQDSRLFPLNHATTSLGVTKKIKSITSVQHASTGTAGSYGFTVAKRLAAVNMGQINVGMRYDFAALGLPRVPDDACLWFVINSSASTTGIITGELVMVQG